MKTWAIAGTIFLALLILWFLPVLLPWLASGPTFDTTVSIPDSIEYDTETTIVVTATNNQDREMVLESIDISDSFLSGFLVLGIEPEPIETYHFFEEQNMYFERTVLPGESLEVKFRLHASKEGRFSGDVDVCTPEDFTTTKVKVVVRNSDQ